MDWYGLRFSPDARFLAARNSYALSVWDVAAQQFATGSSREFSPDTRLLFTHARDLQPEGPRAPDVLQIWDTSTGLPCGPGVATEATPIDLAFDPEIRWLGTLTLHDDRGAQVLRLPVRAMPLAEMERRTWLTAGRRFDEAGDIEVLSEDEIRRLETGAVRTQPPAVVGNPGPAPVTPKPADPSASPGPEVPTLPTERLP